MTERIIPIGPYHPLQEEPEFFRLHVEGERVLRLDIQLGYNHRGIEKLAESKSYDQIIFLVERICGICSTSHPFASVNAVENLIGVAIPERARAIRSAIGELERIHSHLLWLGLAGHFLGYNTVFMWAWKARETVLDIFESISGNRQNYAMFKVGGVRRDIRDDLAPGYLAALDRLRPTLDLFRKAVEDDPVIHARTKGVGVLTADDIRAFGAVGPTARASGVDVDVRRDDPYAAYDRVEWKVCLGSNGDIHDKIVVRLLEMDESLRIIRQCLGPLPPGEIDARVKGVPPGEGIGRHEAPRGEVFHYVRSDGTNRPARYKVRAPSFMNVATNVKAVVGGTISDAAIILAAVDPCYCCTERAVAVEHGTGRRLWGGDDLVRLSRDRTRRLREEMGRP
ncbi:MAG: nickel-dependent hydrogenase large subunit [bacterium]|nr:nickel-dependent hydrogenase large subunit [bacterium]